MIWIAILPRGVSKPMIIQSGTNVNGGVYREMCLRGGLPPVIDEKEPWRRLSLLFSPSSNTLRAWHCPASGIGRSGHPETGWRPSQRAPASPNRGLLGRYEAGGISRRLGGSSEAKLKIRISMALNIIDLEVPLTMMRRVGLHVRSAYRNGPIYIVHLNDMLFGMPQCASVENLVKFCANISDLYRFKISLIN